MGIDFPRITTYRLATNEGGKRVFAIFYNFMKQSFINQQLVLYIETEIIPIYNSFDAAHQIDHVRSVIKESLRLAERYDVNRDMAYVIAAFHDIGLQEDRATHHLVSGRYIRTNTKLTAFFTQDEIELMAQAAEDHRASIDHRPRSIYGMIVAEADRCIDASTIVRRTIQYGLSHYPELNMQEHYQRFLDHMNEKYAEGGYLKIWLTESDNYTKLKEFQELLKDEHLTRQLFERHWNALTHH